jgi:hypothetical protein
VAGSAQYTAVLDANAWPTRTSIARSGLSTFAMSGRAACCGIGPAWESRLPLLRKPWRTPFRTASSRATTPDRGLEATGP